MKKSKVTTKNTIEFLKKKMQECDASEEPFYADAIETLETVDNAIDTYLKNTAEIREWQQSHAYLYDDNKKVLITNNKTLTNK